MSVCSCEDLGDRPGWVIKPTFPEPQCRPGSIVDLSCRLTCLLAFNQQIAQAESEASTSLAMFCNSCQTEEQVLTNQANADIEACNEDEACIQAVQDQLQQDLDNLQSRTNGAVAATWHALNTNYQFALSQAQACVATCCVQQM